MSKLAGLIRLAGKRHPKTAALTTAASLGITAAKFLGKRSIVGAVAGIGVGLVAKKLLDKQMQSSVSAKDDIIEHEPLRPDPNAPKQGE